DERARRGPAGAAGQSRDVEPQDHAPQAHRVLGGAWNTVLAQALVEHAVEARSEEHTSELQSRFDLVCRLLLEKKKYKHTPGCSPPVALCQTEPPVCVLSMAAPRL